MYVAFVTIKLIAIVYYSLLYFVCGFLGSILLNAIVVETQASTSFEAINAFRLMLDSLAIFALASLLFYFLRKVVKQIPFPLENWFGFQSLRLKEVNGVLLLVPIFITFQSKLLTKLERLKEKLKL
jgi:hypothetical protein